MKRSAVALMMLASFVITYWLSMTLLLRANATDNANKLYQALLMAAWMGLIMALLDADWALALPLGAATLLLSLAVRQQWGVDERQFAQSMIEHHGMAIDMTTLALPKLRDPALRSVAANVLRSQQEEIEIMRGALERVR
jgi:hypothetical protein